MTWHLDISFYVENKGTRVSQFDQKYFCDLLQSFKDCLKIHKNWQIFVVNVVFSERAYIIRIFFCSSWEFLLFQKIQKKILFWKKTKWLYWIHDITKRLHIKKIYILNFRTFLRKNEMYKIMLRQNFTHIEKFYQKYLLLFCDALHHLREEIQNYKY